MKFRSFCYLVKPPVFIILLFVISGCGGLFQLKKTSGFRTLTPEDGAKIRNNMPLLTWSPAVCSKYEIYIDGIKMDSVASDKNEYVPFPLSYGDHAWQVVAVDKEKRVESDVCEFTVEDGSLGKVPSNSILLRNNWKVKSSLLVKENGAKLSTPEVMINDWYSTSLPSTVLTALVRNGVYPNPYIGLNNMLIPDMNDKINNQYGLLKYSYIPGKNPWKDAYWFRTEFEVPSKLSGKKLWLNFGEINYRAEVWLNGKPVADTSVMVGMERQFSFDITSLINKDEKNYLAVAIYPPDHPGEPAPEPVETLADPGRNLGQDGIICKDYTKWDVLGWDWQPAIRDRDMGITEDVFLSATDDVEIKDIYVTSDIPLPDTTSADVTISASLVNYSDKAKEGVISGVIETRGKKQTSFEYPFKLSANETKKIILDKSNINELHLVKPHLWWPLGYGSPELYTLKMEMETSSGEVSKDKVNFGIRKVETYIGSKERVYKINGREIFGKGGNWVLDMMLNWTRKRYEQEIRLTKNANINLLRIWGPTGAPPEAFYDAADKYGVLLWQDFLNDFWGSEKNREDLRPDEKLFEKATIDMVKKYRNHPSLVIWCGGNEGPNPREELIMKKVLPEYDGRDSKHYLRISNGDGLHGGGPYHTLNPEEYFKHEKVTGFSSEIGPSGVPEYESMLKFMPDLGKLCKDGRFPLNGDWAYHDATDRPEDTRKFSYYDMIIRNRYGSPDSLNGFGVKDYMRKCQLVNFEVYRASIEALNRQLWTKSSGFGLWKTNSSWPSVVWQIYDWYLQAHAGFYGVRHACEPVHIQLNQDDMSVSMVNFLYKEFSNVKATAEIYDMNMNKIWSMNDSLTLGCNSAVSTKLLVPPQDKLCFLKLTGKDSNGRLLTDNLYWINKTHDYRELKNLAQAQLKAEIDDDENDGQTKYEVTVTNTGSTIAYVVDMKIKGRYSNKELLPTYWSDNYFSLLPGESRKVYAGIDDEDLLESPVIECRAYNMNTPLILVP